VPYLILGIAVVIGLILILRGVGGVDPRRVARAITLIIGMIAIVVAVYFAAVRGVGALWILLAFLLPALMRWRAAQQFFRNMHGPSPGRSSDVETPYLRMKLDHDTGVLDGTVLQGRFQGRRLGEMSEAEVLELLRECRVNDEGSAAILETYLDRVYGAGWRSGDAGAGAGRGSRSSGSRWNRQGGRASANGDMSREEAYEILGLRPGASDEQIKAAHRELMQKMHPDRGGSNYLASKLNQAKDVLLRR
jgi:hypothetical protein